MAGRSKARRFVTEGYAKCMSVSLVTQGTLVLIDVNIGSEPYRHRARHYCSLAGAYECINQVQIE